MALYVINKKEAKLHLSQGNSKIGKTIWNFSTLPGNKDHMLVLKNSVLLTNVEGTCTHLCDGCFGACYAVNSAKLHSNAVIPAWGENTVLLREQPERLFKEIKDFIQTKNSKYYKSQDRKDLKVAWFRINVSGEITSYEELLRWNTLAESCPEVHFGLYTKNLEALGKLLDEKGGSATNFCINVSQWHHCADTFLSKYKGKINVFEYDDSNHYPENLSEEDLKRLNGVTHCPAVTKTGKHAKDANGNDITCDHCLRCYTKTGRTTAVYDH